MIKNGIVGLIAAGGCLGAPNYAPMYDNALSSAASTTVVKEADVKTVKDNINEHLKSLGYTHVDFTDKKTGITVVAKEPSAGAGEDKMIVKCTQESKNVTRVNIANASTTLTGQETVEKDIEQLVTMINED